MIFELNLILRKIRSEKALSLLIVAGLALAFLVAIPLVCNISFHQSFDRFHPGAERIYNVYIDEVYHGTEDIYSELPLAFGEHFTKLYPEVETMARTKDASDVLISHDDKNFWKENVLWVDPTFDDVFHLELLAGNKESFLQSSGEVYISQSLSRKIYGNENAVTKKIKIGGQDYTVGGIFNDYPRNSHQQFSVLIPLKNRIPEDSKYKWDSYEFLTYIKLTSTAHADKLEHKLHSFLSDYWEPWLKNNYNLDFASNSENSFQLKLMPVTDIHLKGSFIDSFEKQGNTSIITINILIVAVLIFIAYFNLMGFSISKGRKHQFQLTIKRMLGVSKKRLVASFVYENLIYSAIAFILAVLITLVLWDYQLPILDDLVMFPPAHFLLPVGILAASAVLMAIITGGLVGSYFSKVILQRQFNKTRSYSNFLFNRVVLITQLAASIILLISILSIYKQLHFLSDHDPEISTENVVVLNQGYKVRDHYDAFKAELKQSPLVKEVCRSNSFPFNWMSTSSYTRVDTNTNPYPFLYFRTDIGFKEVFDIKMKEGSWFSEQKKSDEQAFIFNEAAVRALGLEHPTDERFFRTDKPSEKYHVIGVVDNFNFQSLHHKIKPLMIGFLDGSDWWRYIEVKGNTSNREQLMAHIKTTWTKVSGRSYLDYTFLEDKMAGLYAKERKTKQAIGIFSLVAILISCFGLLGTVLNTMVEKTKEIGIRKVNGAKSHEILVFLNTNFIKWVGLAFIIASPVAWYFMNRWLQNFAYKTELSWWIFVLAGIIALCIALLTVSWQSWKAARRNPVESLRYE